MSSSWCLPPACRRAHRPARQQQVRRGAPRRDRGRRGPHRGRLVRRDGPHRSPRRRRPAVPKVLIRVTPGIEATPTSTSAPASRTRSSASGSPRRRRRPVIRASGSDAMELVGVHAHIGSQVFVADFFAEAVGSWPPVAPLGLPELSIGGGLGVPYVVGESAPTIATTGQAYGPPGLRRGRPPSPDRSPSPAGPSWPRPSPSTGGHGQGGAGVRTSPSPSTAA